MLGKEIIVFANYLMKAESVGTFPGTRETEESTVYLKEFFS